MRIRKSVSLLVTSCRRLYLNFLDGTSLHQGTRRLPAPVTKPLTPHAALLGGTAGPESCIVSLESATYLHRNCGKFDSLNFSAFKDCPTATRGHSAAWATSRFYGTATDSGGSVPVVPSALLDEDLFHELADDVLHQLQEKVEILGEDLNVDGFDSDYASGVLTVRLGNLGTYVINKQTPNRQIWLSSPVSGPGRFDWVESQKVWVYRRTKDELVSLLEREISQLLNTSVRLS